MCLPSIDYVRAFFPYAKIHAIASDRTQDFLVRLSSIDAVRLYRKDWHWKEKLRFSLSLRRKYQAVFDFKHSALPLFVGAPLRTSLIRRIPAAIIHQKDRYLYLTRQVLPEKPDHVRIPKTAVTIEPERRAYWDGFFKTKVGRKAIALAYTSNADKKNYPLERFMRVCQALRKDYPVLLIGRATDASKSAQILSSLLDRSGVFDLAGQTTLDDLWYILQNHTDLLIGNDSGLMHLASYLNIKTVGIFGPTSAREFSPWAEQAIAVVPEKRCRVCQWSRCPDVTARCLYTIAPERVVEAAKELLTRTSDT